MARRTFVAAWVLALSLASTACAQLQSFSLELEVKEPEGGNPFRREEYFGSQPVSLSASLSYEGASGFADGSATHGEVNVHASTSGGTHSAILLATAFASASGTIQIRRPDDMSLVSQGTLEVMASVSGDITESGFANAQGHWSFLLGQDNPAFHEAVFEDNAPVSDSALLAAGVPGPEGVTYTLEVGADSFNDGSTGDGSDARLQALLLGVQYYTVAGVVDPDVIIEFAMDDPILPGDYNDDNVVDAADYSVWQDNLGAPPDTLPNDIDGGAIGQDQYQTWVDHFGMIGGSGATWTYGPRAIPEPGGMWLLLACGAIALLRRGA